MKLKLWKNLLVSVLVLGLLLNLCACARADEPVGNLLPEATQTEAQNPTPTSVAPEENQTVATPTRQCPDNILMRQTGENYDAPVFGNEAIAHEDIITATFLDTLEGMPEDAWDVSEAQNGTVMAWVENGGDLYIAGNGGVTAGDCYMLFFRFDHMTSINFNDCFYTDNTESMNRMFYGCWGLTELDLSFFNTSNVEGIPSMFGNCVNLESVDLSSFDTSNMVSMHDMFFGCEKLTSVDVSHFNTSNMDNLGGMFGGCRSLTSLDLSNFDTGKVKFFDGMFYDCRNLSELDISSFDTSKATDMCQMFMQCKSLTSLDLSHFDTSGVTRFGSMFEGCENLEMLDVSSFRTPVATNFAGMFDECPKLTSLDLSGFDFSQAEMTMEMFRGCSSLTDINCTITLPEGCDSNQMYAGSKLQ